MTPLKWAKCEHGTWCALQSVDLRKIKTTGVYVIWHGGAPGRVVCVGHGDIASQLRDCLNDASVLAYQMMGTLFVTWASVSSSQREGVARYLTDMWHPLLGDGGVTSAPVPVYSPFAA